jgi:hypothetical protein
VRRDGMSPLDFRVMFSLKLVGESINLVVCVLTGLPRFPRLFLKPCAQLPPQPKAGDQRGHGATA